MSGPLLLDGEFIAYYPALAKRLGGNVLRAIIVQALWFRRDRETDKTRMSYDDIAEMVGTSGRTVERQIKWLIENGYISRRRASAADATSVFGVIASALTSDNTPTPPTKTVSRTTRSAGSIPANGGIEHDKVATSKNRPETIPPNGVLDHDNLSSSDAAKLAGSTTSKNKKNNPPTPRSVRTDDMGFSDFWARYPPTEWKSKTNKSNLRGLWFSLTDQQRALTMVALDAYLVSEMWADTKAVTGPKQFLENEPWLEVENDNLPTKKIDPYEGAIVLRPGQGMPPLVDYEEN